jgi:PhnB protein
MTNAETQERNRPARDVMAGVIPYLSMDGKTDAAREFYARAFGATDLGRLPMPDDPGRAIHAQVEINGGALMMTDHRMAHNTDLPPLAVGHLQLVVEDGKAWWDRATSAGCTVVMPFGRQDWGDDWGLLLDPFGIHWAILQPGPEMVG